MENIRDTDNTGIKRVLCNTTAATVGTQGIQKSMYVHEQEYRNTGEKQIVKLSTTKCPD